MNDAEQIRNLLALMQSSNLHGLLPGLTPKPVDTSWLGPLRERARQLAGTPYQALAEALFAAVETGKNLPPEHFPDELWEPLSDPGHPLLHALWPNEWMEAVAGCVTYRCAGSCLSGRGGAAFRSRHRRDYPLFELLLSFLYVNAAPESPEEAVLRRMRQNALTEDWAPLIAVLLDRENAAVTEAVHQAVCENSGAISAGVILSLFYSESENNWQLAADLLLAAKLQEGLRQAVLHCCARGRPDAFKFMMRVIAANGLLRYSSVVRAFGFWLQLAFDASRQDTLKRLFAMALDGLEAPGNFSTSDPREVFCGLWAMAVGDVDAAQERVLALVGDGAAADYVLCAALTFLPTAGVELPLAQGLHCLQKYRENAVICACVCNCFALYDESRGGLPAAIAETRRLYFDFKALLPYFPVKKQTLKHPVFDWIDLPFRTEILWQNVLLRIGRNTFDGVILDDLAASFAAMPTDTRSRFIVSILEYLAPEPQENQYRWLLPSATLEEAKKADLEIRQNFPRLPSLRRALFDALEDRSSSNRAYALDIIARLSVEADELVQVENLLALKTPALRGKALHILRRAGDPAASAQRLRASGNPEKIAAADELVPQRRPEKIIDKSHGYGLYDVDETWNPAAPEPDMTYHPKSILRDDPAAAKKLLADLSGLLNLHRQDECLGREALHALTQIQTTLDKIAMTYRGFRWAPHLAEQLPMPELWDGYFAAHPLPARELVHAFLLLLAPEQPEVRDEFFAFPGDVEEYDNPGFLRAVIQRQLLAMPEFGEFAAAFLIAVVFGTPEAFWQMRLTEKLIFGMDRTISAAENGEMQAVFALCDHAVFNQDTLAARYRLWSLITGDAAKYVRDNLLPAPLLLNAFDGQFISRNTLRRLLLTSQETRFGLSMGTFSWTAIAGHPEIRSLIEDAVTLELGRGEQPTGLSRGLREVRHLSGSHFFVRLLNAIGSSPMVRGYAWGATPDKTTTFSHLLKICRPLPEEDASSFQQQAEPFHFSEKRLLEAAMYSPAWLDIVGAYRKLPALAMAGWYFHAHLHERYNFFAAEKEAYVARYSPISLQDFSDGAFDIDWFREAYGAVGETLFAKLYDAAKYISGGANHRRSQIFADAALGKLTEAEIEENMAAKRNKDLVMAYGILPGKDFLRRYEKLSQFRKESRQFGGQRQASETLAAEIAIGNLARTAGFADVNRFLWQMEAAQFDALKALFEPQVAGDVSIRLVMDESGRAEMKLEKDGKPLKSLPAALKKNENVVAVQSAVKKLREQQTRAKKSLEDAMIGADVFAYGEVRDLMANPILRPLVSKLLWQTGEEVGFFEELPEGTLRIAHPVDLLQSGRWAELQRRAVESRLVQPFKQIFRELYTCNADEAADGMKSDRYSGHQVMANKAVALLRTRGWTVDMEEGLQKVFHKRKLIAKIFAPFAWLTPAEVEPPTLEYVYFLDRATGEMLPLKEIPETFFSEVMRDLDLMVSVAHAGGVDPEASHSTVEMRAALVAALLPLFKLANVRVEKSHAFITGKYGEYTVHLGSGVCHKQAQGMLHLLPVHSQTRGRLFLPFADDDPKTGEVITKILFLAEDGKIKDPAILEQIREDGKRT